MAMHVPKPPGFAQMLKDGARVSLMIQCCRNIVIASLHLSISLSLAYAFSADHFRLLIFSMCVFIFETLGFYHKVVL